MDIAAIRTDVATVGRTAGFNAWDFPPDDPQDYPALVVGGVRSLRRINRHIAEMELVVTLYASSADAQDGTRTLDRALSTGAGDSFIDALDSVSNDDATSWRTAVFTSAGPYQRFSMPGGLVALGVEMILTFTG